MWDEVRLHQGSLELNLRHRSKMIVVGLLKRCQQHMGYCQKQATCSRGALWSEALSLRTESTVDVILTFTAIWL